MQDDTGTRRPLSHATIARLLLEASGDPRLRILFGLPPKRQANVAPHGLRHSAVRELWHRRPTDLGSKDSKTSVVQFPIVARRQAYRSGTDPSSRRGRARQRVKPPKKP